MADKRVPSPEVADDMDKLLAYLKSSALPKSAAACATGADTPDEAKALEQGKAAGSTVTEAKLVASRPGEGNANAQPVLEVGDDPSKAKNGPTVSKSSADGIEEIVQSGENMVIKQASALADQMDAIDKQLLHLAAAEVVVELAVQHRAEMEEAAMSEAIPELQASLDIKDPEVAAQLAQAILAGEVDESEITEAVEQNANLKEIAAATGSQPEEIMAIAEQLGQEAESTGKPIEQIVQEAMGALQKQAMAEAQKEYNAADALVKKASAEGDAFSARMAQRRMLEIEKWLDNVGTSHVAACKKEAEAEEPAEEAAPEAEPAEAAPEAEAPAAAETEIAADAATDEGAATGQEGLAAGMMAQQVAPEQLQLVSDAIQALVDAGVPPEAIAQVVQERMAGQVPDLSKVASAEELEADPKLMAHVAIDMAIRKASANKGA